MTLNLDIKFSETTKPKPKQIQCRKQGNCNEKKNNLQKVAYFETAKDSLTFKIHFTFHYIPLPFFCSL